MNVLLSPANFLKIGGTILLALAVIGFTGLTNSIEAFNLDAGENVAHTVLGIVALAAGFALKDAEFQRWLVVLVALTGLATGIYGFALPVGSFMHGNFFGLANLENPADNVLHVVVGIWAAAAAYVNKPAERMVPRPA